MVRDLIRLRRGDDEAGDEFAQQVEQQGDQRLDGRVRALEGRKCGFEVLKGFAGGARCLCDCTHGRRNNGSRRGLQEKKCNVSQNFCVATAPGPSDGRGQNTTPAWRKHPPGGRLLQSVIKFRTSSPWSPPVFNQKSPETRPIRVPYETLARNRHQPQHQPCGEARANQGGQAAFPVNRGFRLVLVHKLAKPCFSLSAEIFWRDRRCAN